MSANRDDAIFLGAVFLSCGMGSYYGWGAGCITFGLLLLGSAAWDWVWND